MPRQRRTDKADSINPALNRGALGKRFSISGLPSCGKTRVRGRLVRRAEQWRFGSMWRWLQNSEPKPKLFSPWPIP